MSKKRRKKSNNNKVNAEVNNNVQVNNKSNLQKNETASNDPNVKDTEGVTEKQSIDKKALNAETSETSESDNKKSEEKKTDIPKDEKTDNTVNIKKDDKIKTEEVQEKTDTDKSEKTDVKGTDEKRNDVSLKAEPKSETGNQKQEDSVKNKQEKDVKANNNPAAKKEKIQRPEKKEPVIENKKMPLEDTLEFAIETEPDVIKNKRSFKDVMKKIVAIITAPEDNDLNYGEDDNYDDIFFEEEQTQPVNQDSTSTQSVRKKELPKTLLTSSLYTNPQTKIQPKQTAENKSAVQNNTVTANTADSNAEFVQGELKEHIPYKTEQKNKEEKTENKVNDTKKIKKPRSGQEITVKEILKAKKSVPERSSKAYGSMDTADKAEREKETEIPIFVKKQDNKNQQSEYQKNYHDKAKKEFDLSSLSDDKQDVSKDNRKDELSHDPSSEKQKELKIIKTDELSHPASTVNKADKPEIHKNDELAHKPKEKPVEEPESNQLKKTSEKPVQQRKEELHHSDQDKVPDLTKIVRQDELSHKTELPINDNNSENKPVKQNTQQDVKDKSENNVKQQPDVSNTADSLPGGAGVKIDPWIPKKKDTAENKSDVLMYRSSEISPFIVMAGKFTRTLKNEYDNTRKLRQSLPPEPPKPPSGDVSANKPPQPAEKPKAPVQTSKEKKVVRKDNKDKAAETKTDKSKISDITKVSRSKKAEKSKKKFKISDIFNYDGDTFDEEEPEEEIKPEISDYNKEEDAEEIKNDINDNFRKVFTRTIVLICTCLASIITVILAKFMPEVFVKMMKNGWLIYSFIMFFLFLVSIFVARYPIVNGFMPLRKLKGNSDTPVSIAALAVAVQSIVSLFQPDVFLNETYHIYVPLLVLALLLNSMGKLLIIKRTSNNFKFLRKKEARYAGKIYTKTENAERFVSGLPSRRPIIAYSKFSKFMSNFLQLSYAADPVEELSAMIAPFAALLSLVGSVIFGIYTKDFVGGISFMALTSCITIPMCSLLAINIPMLNFCSTANRNGAMVVGYEAVKQFCDTNTIMIDSADLYPKGNIILSGMKTINESKLQEAISAGASMTFAVNGPLTHVFETIVRQSKYKLPEYESISYDDKMGLSGWCNGNRILIGGRALFEKHNIKLPDETIEEKYRKRGNEIAYISVGGELAVMFILTYKVDRTIAQSLRNLEESGVNFVVRTIDPNITQDHIAKKFSLFPRCIKVLPTELGQLCYEEISAKEKTSRAYLVTNGKLSSFANAVNGCIKIKSTVTIAKIVQYLAIIIGFILVSIISFISGFAKLGSLELLLYTGFWCAALIVVSIAARRLS